MFECHDETLQLGLKELQDEAVLRDERIQHRGGGRKSAIETIAGLEVAFLRVIEQHSAGSAMAETVKWTNLTRQQIAQLLEGEGIRVSVTVVDQRLEKHNFRKRKAVKTLGAGESEQRNEQFETIEHLKQSYQAVGNPVMSMDTKKEN
ncbi:ISAzo13-like element transposase-related protein [Phormidesmis priestleyi]